MAQFRATRARLRHSFEEAARNIEAQLGSRPSKLARLELDAVVAQAGDLRAELDEYERLRAGTV